MHPVNLKVGLRLMIDNECYFVMKLVSNDVELQGERFKNSKIYTKDELITLLCSNRLKFEVTGKNTTLSETIRTKYDFDNIEDIKYRDEAIFRYKVIEPLLSMPAALRRKEDVIKRVEEVNALYDNPNKFKEIYEIDIKKKISFSSTYRWLKDYIESERDIRA